MKPRIRSAIARPTAETDDADAQPADLPCKRWCGAHGPFARTDEAIANIDLPSDRQQQANREISDVIGQQVGVGSSPGSSVGEPR